MRIVEIEMDVSMPLRNWTMMGPHTIKDSKMWIIYLNLHEHDIDLRTWNLMHENEEVHSHY